MWPVHLGPRTFRYKYGTLQGFHSWLLVTINSHSEFSQECKYWRPTGKFLNAITQNTKVSSLAQTACDRCFLFLGCDTLLLIKWFRKYLFLRSERRPPTSLPGLTSPTSRPLSRKNSFTLPDVPASEYYRIYQVFIWSITQKLGSLFKLFRFLFGHFLRQNFRRAPTKVSIWKHSFPFKFLLKIAEKRGKQNIQPYFRHY